MRRGLIAAVFVVTAGTAALWWGTDGFHAYTSEAARRLAVRRSPHKLPPIVLQDQDGQTFRLQDYRGKILVVGFIYTRCPTACNTLGFSFRSIERRISTGSLGHKVVLLSISFDSRHDIPARLKEYAHRFGADGIGWRIARVLRQSDLKPMLGTFGVTIVPNRAGGFEHNAAISLVDARGRLVEIVDYDKPLQVIEAIKAKL